MKYIKLDHNLFAHNKWRELPHSAKHIFQLILLHRNNKTGLAFPSEARLSALSGLSRKTVSKAVRTLNTLNDFHIITKKENRQGKFEHNIYEYNTYSKTVQVPQWIIHRYPDITRQAISTIPTMCYLSKQNLITASKHRIAKTTGINHHAMDTIINDLRKIGFLRQKKDGLFIQTEPPKPKVVKVNRYNTSLPKNFQ